MTMLPEAPRPSPATLPAPSVSPRTTAGIAAGDGAEKPGAFARVLRGMGRELDTGERAAREALAGRDLSAAELLVLQSRIYRYSEVVDLAAKLVDRASNGVRTVVQGQ